MRYRLIICGDQSEVVAAENGESLRRFAFPPSERSPPPAPGPMDPETAKIDREKLQIRRTLAPSFDAGSLNCHFAPVFVRVHQLTPVMTAVHFKSGPIATVRTEAFSYECRRCMRCCAHKVIQINPYEVARLARNRGVSTTQFRERWTQDGAGTILARDETDICVFLGKDGCTVHPDRPLVCRLYPLGRQVDSAGKEVFSSVAPHPQSLGRFGFEETIADFLRTQDAYPFMKAADDYYRWICRVNDALAPAEKSDARIFDDARGTAVTWLDMDPALDQYCRAQGLAPPQDIEARRELHLRMLDANLEKCLREKRT